MTMAKAGLSANRDHYQDAQLQIGSVTLRLIDYATTGMRAITVGPSGIGKTNTGLVFAEQLSRQGWVCVVMDPEGEVSELYQDREAEIVGDTTELEQHLSTREHPLLIVKTRDADEFVEYGQVVMAVADTLRKPIFLFVDEGQMFSASRGKRKTLGEASDLINDMVERGRKRNLDLFFTAHRFSGSLHRSVFTNRNICFVGRQEDPTAWQPLAPLFQNTSIGFGELSALAPGEFFCFSRRGVEKVYVPMADALAAAAPPATIVPLVRPVTYSQWDRAMRAVPTARLQRLTPFVVDLMSGIVGLSAKQIQAGYAALSDELQARR
jgi:hypothetical protein